MLLKLSEKWIKHVKKLPESGMGYKNVNVYKKDNSSFFGRILNGDTLETDYPITNEQIVNIKWQNISDRPYVYDLWWPM